MALVLTHLWQNLGLYAFGGSIEGSLITIDSPVWIKATLYVRLLATLLYVFEKVEASLTEINR